MADQKALRMTTFRKMVDRLNKSFLEQTALPTPGDLEFLESMKDASDAVLDEPIEDLG